MTIRQLIHSGPAKANELFAKLAETGGGAVRTRERLFSELKEELELLAGLEEKHLFPALRKHKEAKELGAGARADAEGGGGVPQQAGGAAQGLSAACARREEGAAARGQPGAERRGGSGG